jgi:hypothetical protein
MSSITLSIVRDHVRATWQVHVNIDGTLDTALVYYTDSLEDAQGVRDRRYHTYTAQGHKVTVVSGRGQAI